MRETQFIDRNRDKWAKYENALKRDQEDPDLLTELYVHTTDDLSYSRTFYPNRSVRVYLNDLARRTFLQIYRNRRGEARRFLTFWTDELPRILFRRRRPLLISLLVFVLSMGAGVLSYRIDAEFAELILGQGYVDMTREFIRSGDPMAVYKQRGAYSMFLAITFNNIFVALKAFIMGAFFAVGTVVMLIQNGIMLGVFQYFFVDQELFRESFLTIWIHGALEISSIVIAGGAGLTMGSGLLFPGTYTRLQAFGRSARDGLKIMLGTIPLFVIAGFLESYLTRHTELPDALRFFFILACFAYVIWYYWYYPRQVIRRPPLENKLEERHLRPRDDQPIATDRIKALGELLTETYTILRRSGGRMLLAVGGAAVTFCLLVFGLTDQSPANRFVFSDDLLSPLYNIFVLTSTFGFGRDFTFFAVLTLSILLLLYLGGRIMDRIVHRKQDNRSGSWVRLIPPALMISVVFSLPGPFLLFIAFLALPFMLMYAYTSYVGIGGIAMAFRYTYSRLATTYGLFFLLLLLGIFVIFLLDTAVGRLFFAALSWVIPTDVGQLYEYNVIIQAWLYWGYFSLLTISWFLGLALHFHSIHEEETATGLLARIESIGWEKRLRGLELE